MAGKLFIISAPSGAGKTSLVTSVMQRIGFLYDLKWITTFTSRPPRFSEQDGRDYHFIPPQEFGQRIRDGFFLEWSSVYNGYYGSCAAILTGLAKGTSYIMILDRQGAACVKSRVPDAVLIWFHVSPAVAQQRLEKRGTEMRADIMKRVSISSVEARQEATSPIYTHHIIHEDFTATQTHLISIICTYITTSFH